MFTLMNSSFEIISNYTLSIYHLNVSLVVGVRLSRGVGCPKGGDVRSIRQVTRGEYYGNVDGSVPGRVGGGPRGVVWGVSRPDGGVDLTDGGVGDGDGMGVLQRGDLRSVGEVSRGKDHGDVDGSVPCGVP